MLFWKLLQITYNPLTDDIHNWLEKLMFSNTASENSSVEYLKFLCIMRFLLELYMAFVLLDIGIIAILELSRSNTDTLIKSFLKRFHMYPHEIQLLRGVIGKHLLVKKECKYFITCVLKSINKRVGTAGLRVCFQRLMNLDDLYYEEAPTKICHSWIKELFLSEPTFRALIEDNDAPIHRLLFDDDMKCEMLPQISNELVHQIRSMIVSINASQNILGFCKAKLGGISMRSFFLTTFLAFWPCMRDQTIREMLEKPNFDLIKSIRSLIGDKFVSCKLGLLGLKPNNPLGDISRNSTSHHDLIFQIAALLVELLNGAVTLNMCQEMILNPRVSRTLSFQACLMMICS